MNIQKNISIKPYNTFAVDAKAAEFVEISSVEELKEALSIRSEVFPLGGGSNVLITKDIEIPVLKINIKGIEIIRQDENFVWIEVGAGEIWHEFVQFCIENNYGGVENLSLIPGSVGASPIQNIGAYGVEIKDVMDSCKALHIASLQLHTFTAAQCHFGYRDSIFKNTHKGQYIITSVTFRLTKTNHRLHIDYGAIKQYLSDNQKDIISLREISQAVIAIRQSKLPDPKELGNSGSFFKNSVISVNFLEALKSKYPQMPSYVVSENQVKIPAGWLIESLGLKGYRKGNVGVHQRQSLVLVNYGGACGKEIFDLAKYVQKLVKDTYGIELEMEVNVI